MRFLAVAALLLSTMTGCFGSGEPTEQDLRAALDEHLNEMKRMYTVPTEFVPLDFSKIRCVKQSDGAFDCLAATTVRASQKGETQEAKRHFRAVIAKESVGWVRQKSELLNPT